MSKAASNVATARNRIEDDELKPRYNKALSKPISRLPRPPSTSSSFISSDISPSGVQKPSTSGKLKWHQTSLDQERHLYMRLCLQPSTTLANPLSSRMGPLYSPRPTTGKKLNNFQISFRLSSQSISRIYSGRSQRDASVLVPHLGGAALALGAHRVVFCKGPCFLFLSSLDLLS
jgi:hypothetical protein